NACALPAGRCMQCTHGVGNESRPIHDALLRPGDAVHRTPVAPSMTAAYPRARKETSMTLFALLSWIVVGLSVGAILAALWKIPGLTLAWGFAAGGVGGVVGGMIGRMVFPTRLFTEGLALVTAIAGAVVAMLISRALFPKARSPT